MTQDDGHLRIGALMRHRELERDATRERAPAVARRGGPPRGEPSHPHSRNARRLAGALGPRRGAAARHDPARRGVRGDGRRVATDRVGGGVPPVLLHDRARRGRAARSRCGCRSSGPGWGWGFVEVSRRPGDFALVAAAALVRVARAEIVEARVALGGVAERPMRVGGGRDGGRGRPGRETWTGGSDPSRGSNRSRTRAPRRSTAGIWRASSWSARWRTPWRARKEAA